MLKNNKLLIDEDCPLCCLYGTCFTQLEWVDAQTIQPYQRISEEEASGIDMERAKSEIALKDEVSGQMAYGVDAMIKIFVSRFRWAGPLLNHWLVYGFLKQLYSFISFNRKVICPVTPNPNLRVCEPASNPFYRWLYIVFVAVVTGVILNQWVYFVNTDLGLIHDWSREYYICFGQVAWQMMAIALLAKDKLLDYLGNMSTVSLIGGLLLLPVLLVNSWVPMNFWLLLLLFGLVVSFMLVEHIRRCKLLGISLLMTYSWILYRVVVLVIVLAVILF